MKKAFTLIELMVVVAVIVTLMTIVFRLGSIGGESAARVKTIERIQRLESALSGYHAAFGTYPPVKLHGSRNVFLKVNDRGIQSDEGEEDANIWNWINGDGTAVKDDSSSRRAEQAAWNQVEAACRSQPIGCEYPFAPGFQEQINAASVLLGYYGEKSSSASSETKAICQAGFDDGVTSNIGRFGPYKGEESWDRVQIFKFGVMSFLLPRYLVMMNGDRSFFSDYAQWSGNNALPCDPLTGERYEQWSGFKNIVDNANSGNSSDMAKVANIPSQSACARWMPCFEKAVCTVRPLKLYGVDLQEKADNAENNSDSGGLPHLVGAEIAGRKIYSPGGYGQTGGQNYVLDGATLMDGWAHELFYYSPPPYQSYTVWSAGKNGRTFPPWVSRKDLDSQANKCVSYWVKDDLVGLSN